MTKQPVAVMSLTAILVFGASCRSQNDGGGGSTPSTPTPQPQPAPAPAANRAPSITSLSVSPTFGVSSLSPIAMSATASDPDNDALTFSWTFPGGAANGSSTSATLSGDGIVNVTLTVTDGKGGSVSDARSVTLGSLTGTWSLTAAACGTGSDRPAVMALTQTSGIVNGTVTFPGNWCNVRTGQSNGRLDPGAPGKIDAAGNFSARVKVGDFVDVFLNQGKMDASGRRITGKPEGSGFGNSTDVFIMTKQ